jgi:hypothetical protein
MILKSFAILALLLVSTAAQADPGDDILVLSTVLADHAGGTVRVWLDGEVEATLPDGVTVTAHVRNVDLWGPGDVRAQCFGLAPKELEVSLRRCVEFMGKRMLIDRSNLITQQPPPEPVPGLPGWQVASFSELELLPHPPPWQAPELPGWRLGFSAPLQQRVAAVLLGPAGQRLQLQVRGKADSPIGWILGNTTQFVWVENVRTCVVDIRHLGDRTCFIHARSPVFAPDGMLWVREFDTCTSHDCIWPFYVRGRRRAISRVIDGKLVQVWTGEVMDGPPEIDRSMFPLEFSEDGRRVKVDGKWRVVPPVKRSSQ